MSLESVKSVVSRMSKDGEFKHQVLARPEVALSSYDLTVTEREAICKFGFGVTDSEAGPQPLDSWV